MNGFTKQVIRDLFHFLFPLNDGGRLNLSLIMTQGRLKISIISIFYLIFLLKNILLVMTSLVVICDRGNSLVFIWLLFHLF